MNEEAVPVTSQHPEHCHRCYCLITAGGTYYQTAENTVLCGQCAEGEPLDTVQVSDELTVEIHEDHLILRRDEMSLDVRLDEVRHLVDALVDRQVQ